MLWPHVFKISSEASLGVVGVPGHLRLFMETHWASYIRYLNLVVVENIRCGGNDLRLGFYTVGWNG